MHQPRKYNNTTDKPKSSINVGYSGITIIQQDTTEPIKYLNVKVQDYYTTYTIVHDICDVESNFIMVEDFLEMVKESNYYIPLGHWGDSIDIVDMGAVSATLSSGLIDPKCKQRVWFKFDDIFPNLLEYTKVAQAIRHHKDSLYKCEWKMFKGTECFCIATMNIGGVPRGKRKKKIYKLGLTRSELREYWKQIVYALDEAFKHKKIPVSALQRDMHNIDVVVAFAKQQGIDFDMLYTFLYYSRSDVSKKIYKQLYRSPTKYKIIPKNLETKVDIPT